jgi:hypothetical protein
MADEPVDHSAVDKSADAAAGFGMTDLEEAVRAAGGSVVAKALLERFSSLDEALSARIAGGLPPDAYTRATVIRNSLAAASNILIRLPKG